MSRTLSARSTLETLKKEAKRWRDALRAGDANARERLLAVTPDAPDSPSLRDVQLALAREYGFAGWTNLKRALEGIAIARRALRDVADDVLRQAVFVGESVVAERLLVHRPEVVDVDLYTAVAAGRVDTVRAALDADPAAAKRKGGPLDWEPLLYLAYMRLPGAQTHAVEIATLLLEHGADPNAEWNDGWDNPFTVITGLIGEGEGDKPPHPCADELVALLLDRGADPFDTQTFYNTSITRDETKWLDVLWTCAERRGETQMWRTVLEKRIGGSLPASALDFMLGLGVAYGHPRRVEWLLDHGANVNGRNTYSHRLLREEALVYGNVEMAELLVRRGAHEAPLSDATAFQAACMRLDRDAATELAARDPRLLRRAEPMLEAARMGRADVVALLLELGVDVDVWDRTELRGLQAAVMGGSLDVVQLLVEHGAAIDRPTKHYGGAMGFAAHFRRRDIAAFLAPRSRDVYNLVNLGMTDRLADLFAEEPSLVNVTHPRGGVTPIFFLPDDEDDAVQLAEFLLAQGADPAISGPDGRSAEAAARKRGLIDAAELIREAAGG